MAGEAGKPRPERDAAYVRDIVECCCALESYVRGKGLEDFRTDPLLQDAVARRLFVIGEAAKSVSDAFKKKLPELDWKNIGRLRDKLAHHYGSIELEKIWEIVTDYLPTLRATLQAHPISKE